MPRECVFCGMVGDRRTVPHWVAESDRALAFLDIRPLREGHTLVIPKRHARDLSEIAPDELGAVAELAHAVAARLRARLGGTGENLFVASGRDAEQTVFHLHIHVIPRRPGDDLDIHSWWFTKTRATPTAELEGLARRLRED